MKKYLQWVIVLGMLLVNINISYAVEESQYSLSTKEVVLNSQYDMENDFLKLLRISKTNDTRFNGEATLIEPSDYKKGVPGTYHVSIGLKGNDEVSFPLKITVVQSKAKIIDLSYNGEKIIKLPSSYYDTEDTSELDQEMFLENYKCICDVTYQLSDGTNKSSKIELPLTRAQYKGGDHIPDDITGLFFFLGYSNKDNLYKTRGYYTSGTENETIDYSKYEVYNADKECIYIYNESLVLNLEVKDANDLVQLNYQSRDFYDLVNELKVDKLNTNYFTGHENYALDVTSVGDGQYPFDASFDAAFAHVTLTFDLLPGYMAETTKVYRTSDLETPLPTKIVNGKFVLETLYPNGIFVFKGEPVKDQPVIPEPPITPESPTTPPATGSPSILNPKFDLGSQDLTTYLDYTEEDLKWISEGNKVKLNVIVDSLSMDTYDKDIMKTINNALVNNDQIAYLLDIGLLKNASQNTTLHQLKSNLKITIDIPKEILGKDYYTIYRYHDGKVAALKDLDTNPDTITFETDRFSPYAIAYGSTKSTTEDITLPNNKEVPDTSDLTSYIWVSTILLSFSVYYKVRRKY